MTEPSPIPACLSHLTQRDAAVRVRAFEEAAKMEEIRLHFLTAKRIRALIPTPPAPAPDEAPRPMPPNGCHGVLELCRNAGYCTRGHNGGCDAGEVCPSENWQPAPPALAPDEARGPHNACGAGSCDQPDRCARESECHYTKSPFYQPSRAAPDEAAIRAELVAALRDMLIPYNGVPDDALQQGAENGDQRCVRALKARVTLAKAD